MNDVIHPGTPPLVDKKDLLINEKFSEIANLYWSSVNWNMIRAMNLEFKITRGRYSLAARFS